MPHSTVSDVDLQSGMVKVMGKGQKERVTRLGSVALRTLKRYIRRRELKTEVSAVDHSEWSPQVLGDQQHDPQDRIRSRRSGMPPQIQAVPALCSFSGMGRTIFSVQHLLGHADIGVLRQYLGPDEGRHNPCACRLLTRRPVSAPTTA